MGQGMEFESVGDFPIVLNEDMPRDRLVMVSADGKQSITLILEDEE